MATPRRAKVRCSGCGHVVRIESDSTGAANCPKCGKRFRFKLPDPPPANGRSESTSASDAADRQWEVIAADGSTHGSYTFDEMVGFIQQGLVQPASVVRHPVETDGEQRIARNVSILARYFAAVHDAEPPLDDSEPEPTPEPPPFTPHRQESQTFYRPIRRERYQESFSSIVYFFDLSFQRYVTPWVIRFTWLMLLLMSGGTLLLYVIAFVVSNVPAPSIEGAETLAQPRGDGFELPELGRVFGQLFVRLVAMVYLIIILGLSVLWSRVLLEMAIVLFNISNSLKSIDRKVPER